MSAVAEVIDLDKDYFLGPEPLHVLKRLTLSVAQGDFVALMGPSGSGKSTLLNILGCLDRPTRGAYYLAGQNVAEMEDDDLSDVRSKYLGFIFQSYNLLPQYTVVENIEIPLLYQGARLSAETRDRCVRLAELVGLGDRLDHRPNQLSGGQQQRVAIARSLINDPYIILADQAPGNLDTKTSHEIMEMLGRLNDSGKTIIMVTHEDDIAEHAKRIIRMRDGLIIDDGPSARMRAAQEIQAAALTGVPPTNGTPP